MPRFSGLSLCLSPYSATRKAVRFHGLSLHLDAISGTLRRHIARVADHYRVEEMLMQMIHVLDDATVHRSGDGDEIEHREMLHVLAQPHTARMRTYRNPEFRGHQENRQILVDAANSATIDLAIVDG